MRFTDDHGACVTATGIDAELAAVNACLWGPTDQLAGLLGELDSGLFVDPWCREVVELVHQGATTVDMPDALRARGWVGPCAPSVVLADVTAAGGRLDALAFYLGRLREGQERRRVLAQLVALADTLERPGGPARVAEVLEWGRRSRTAVGA